MDVRENQRCGPMLSIIVNAIKWYKYAPVEFLTYVLQKILLLSQLVTGR